MEEPFSSYFTPDLADLVDVALAVYTADRLCPRQVGPTNRYDHYWQRRLHLEIPVRDPEKWQDEQVAMRLRDLLVFMTEDDWDFRFVLRNGQSRVVQDFLFDTRPTAPITAALFSGGLDSLAGLCVEANERQGDAFILFSGWTNARLASRQRRLASALAGRVGTRVVSVRVPFGITHAGSSYDDDEPTQRTRGFVHSVLGAVVALHAGSHELACYENGVGALNLPLTAAQLGSQNARSAHPVTLAEIAELIRLVSGRRFRMRLPFLFRTKAELCAGISEAGLQALIAESVSCDGFPRRVKGKPQCGECTSCLLRRQALQVAGLYAWDPSEQYGFAIERAQSKGYPYELHAMLDQAWKIREAVTGKNAWSGLSTLYPQLEATVCDLGQKGRDMAGLRNGFAALFTRYHQDWAHFAQPDLPLLHQR